MYALLSIRFKTVHVLIVDQRLAARSTGKFKTPVLSATVDIQSIISFSSQCPVAQRGRRGVNPIRGSRLQVSISNFDPEIPDRVAGIVICKMRLQMHPKERRSKYRGL